MNRRQAMKVAFSAAVGASMLRTGRLLAQETETKAQASEGNTIYLNPVEGSEAARIGADLFTKMN